MFVKITNGQAQANYTIGDLRKENPNVSFPRNISNETLAKFNVFRVKEVAAPDYNHRTHRLVTQAPELVDGLWTVSRIAVAKDQAQIDSENEQMAASVRSDRDSKLANSDWTQVADAPVDQTAWANYRQALRDVPEQAGFPWEVIWPEQPA
jgi:hypothetical protein